MKQRTLVALTWIIPTLLLFALLMIATGCPKKFTPSDVLHGLNVSRDLYNTSWDYLMGVRAECNATPAECPFTEAQWKQIAVTGNKARLTIDSGYSAFRIYNATQQHDDLQQFFVIAGEAANLVKQLRELGGL